MKTLTVMSALQTLIEKSKAKQSTFFELLGFVVLSAGIFCGLALFTYDPGDPTQITTTGETYRNMGGPVGAWLANSLLSTLGMVSLLIAIVLFFCGALMALGFIRWPKPKRFVGFAVILVVLAGYCIPNTPPQAPRICPMVLAVLSARCSATHCSRVSGTVAPSSG